MYTLRLTRAAYLAETTCTYYFDKLEIRRLGTTIGLEC